MVTERAIRQLAIIMSIAGTTGQENGALWSIVLIPLCPLGHSQYLLEQHSNGVYLVIWYDMALTCIYRRGRWPPRRGWRPGGRGQRTLWLLWRGRRWTQSPGGRRHTRCKEGSYEIGFFGNIFFGTPTFRYTKSTDRTCPRSLHSFRWVCLQSSHPEHQQNVIIRDHNLK